MSKPQHISVRDALRVVRAAQAIRELPAGTDLQKQHMAMALCRLLGAQVGVVNTGAGFRPGRRPHLGIPVARGWVGETERKEFARYLATDDHCVDPILPAIAGIRARLHTRRRADVVTDDGWYGTHHVSEERKLARVDDVMYSTQVIDPRTGDVIILGVHRPWGDPVPFSPRDRAVFNLFHRALADVLTVRDTDPFRRRAAALSPRLRQALELLLEGLPEKAVARQLGLSRHTVHGYIKQIYDHFGVESRPELIARWAAIASGAE